MKTKVKELRMAAKMTQQQLADMVHVSSRTIISIEKEQYSPSLMLAYRMAEIFGVTVEELCCLKENKELEDLQYEDSFYAETGIYPQAPVNFMFKASLRF